MKATVGELLAFVEEFDGAGLVFTDSALLRKELIQAGYKDDTNPADYEERGDV